MNTKTSSNLTVNADKEMLTTALRNILTNALKFSEYNSTVTVNILQDEKLNKITVANAGPGIKEEDIPLLFKIDSDPTKIGNHPEKGFGMGLMISNELLKLNDGFVKVENGSPENTVFSINLIKN